MTTDLLASGLILVGLLVFVFGMLLCGAAVVVRMAGRWARMVERIIGGGWGPWRIK